MHRNLHIVVAVNNPDDVDEERYSSKSFDSVPLLGTAFEIFI
jgi:hypothetical protein